MDKVVRGVLPFLWSQLIVLALLVLFPDIAMVPAKWLYGR